MGEHGTMVEPCLVRGSNCAILPPIQRRTYKQREPDIRANEAIRAPELRVIGADGVNLGVLSREEALAKARVAELDLIEVSPHANPPVARIADFGKYLYQEKKKARATKAKSHATETKSVQIKIATGDHDLELKAKRAGGWLSEGHRVKVELFLSGRAKYLDRGFLEGRLNRFLKLVTESYRIAEPIRKDPKGLALILERAK